MATGEVLSIPDTFVDIRVRHMPAVVGEPHFRWYLGTPLRSSDNQLIGALCVLDTKDDGLEATDAMKASLLDLAECVTTELELRADCAVALQAKKEFLTSVSHELRDPMHGISMGLELLTTAKPNTAEEKLALDSVRKCSLSLEGLVDKILCINDKPTGNLSTSSKEVINVAEVVENILESTWHRQETILAHDSAILIPVLQIDHDLIVHEHVFDPCVLMNILLNLFSNSLKFTRSGNISVKIGSQECDREVCGLGLLEHKTVEIVVKDTGCGMSTEFLGRAFDQFTQEDASKAGVGLGLSVVKKLVQDNSGTISMTSSEQQGTRVSVKFCMERVYPSNGDNPRSPSICTSKSFWLASNFLPELQDSIESYCSNFGMSPSIEASNADIIIAMYYGETDGLDPSILISSQRHANMEDELGPTDLLVSLPLGPLKIRQALAKVLSSQSPYLPSVMIEDGSEDTPSRRFEGLNITLPELSSRSPSTPRVSQSSGVRSCLVVDDNPVNTKILCAFLKRRGYRYVCAADGIEAVNAVEACDRDSPFEIILMDINMPNMNGVEASKHIREYQTKHDIRRSLIIAISGCSDAEQMTAMYLGMKHFFKKPVDLRKLTQFIDEALLIQ